MIALHRPGAIGDCLMTLNLIPLLKQHYPGEEIAYCCHPGIGSALWQIMKSAGVDHVVDCARWPLPLVNTLINLIGYPLQDGYPDRPMKRHLIEYFGKEMGIEWVGALPSLKLDLPKIPAMPPHATLQVKAGWSVYKEWPIERWERVVKALPHIPFYQIGVPGDRHVDGAYQALFGTPLSTSISFIANAKLHVGIDSFANHVTNFTWRGKGKTPAVILWGSTQWSAAGYPHNTNISRSLLCQPCFREDPAISRMSRGPCISPPGQTYDNPKHDCMAAITVAEVVSAIQDKWNSL
jgi:ADP-heptose:LPS heptosyltransferase